MPTKLLINCIPLDSSRDEAYSAQTLRHHHTLGTRGKYSRKTRVPWRQHERGWQARQGLSLGASWFWTAVAILVQWSWSSLAQAQHAADNVVVSAEDAFGLTKGLEHVGMYAADGIRGFNPQAAGNVRLEGLFFDQQGGLSDRVIEDSTVRVGASEIGYAFPAPTGIVDYQLREPNPSGRGATILASRGSFEAYGGSIDGTLPTFLKQFELPLGVSYKHSTNTSSAPNAGYTSTVANIGAAPRWKISDRVTVRAFFDWQHVTHAKTLPIVLTAGDFIPPHTRRAYVGQDWAEGESVSKNYGGSVAASFGEHWSLAAGLFRSVALSPISYNDLYLNTQLNGSADHAVVGYPEQESASTSGEARLTGRFGSGAWRHEFIVLMRGRDTLSHYGGYDVVNVGPAFIDQGRQVPKPAFVYSALTADRTKLLSVGVAYRGQWRGHGDFAFGLQKESYDKSVTEPLSPEVRLADRPYRAYAAVALPISAKVTAYAGYTQGLEDSGVVPSGATNQGAILPASRTWQADAGVNYQLTSKVKLIAGIFAIEKPYFNVDSQGVDRALGVQRATGLELSLSGEIIRNLHLTAGVLLGQVKISGPDLAASGVGTTAFGQPHIQSVINADYRLIRWPAFSVDLTAAHFGVSPASVNNVAQNPPQTLVHLGGRFQFKMMGHSATVRVLIRNLGNYYFWNIGYSPGFTQFPQRSVFGYLTVDI